jgi:hypothetical protein
LLPVARLAEQFSDILQTLLILTIESAYLGAINVKDTDDLPNIQLACDIKHLEVEHGRAWGTDLSTTLDWNHNLTPAVAVASNMTWKLLDVLDQHRLPLAFCRSTTYALSNPDRLASHLPHEWAENQLLLRIRGVEHVKATPIHG